MGDFNLKYCEGERRKFDTIKLLDKIKALNFDGDIMIYFDSVEDAHALKDAIINLILGYGICIMQFNREIENQKAEIKMLKDILGTPESNTVSDWIKECCELDRRSRVERSVLYEHYSQYCESEDRQSLSKTRFFAALRSRGLQEIKSNGKRIFVGIKICA